MCKLLVCFILAAFFWNEAYGDDLTEICKNDHTQDYTCTVHNGTPLFHSFKCCASVSHSNNAPTSGGHIVYSCCHKTTANLNTAYCSNDYAKQFCNHDHTKCCIGVVSSHGSFHNGCCSKYAASCSDNRDRKVYWKCGGEYTKCCKNQPGSKVCCSASRVLGGKTNPLFLLVVAVVVLLTTMVVVPIPLMLVTK